MAYRSVVEVDKVSAEIVKRYPSVSNAAARKGMSRESVAYQAKYCGVPNAKTYFRYEDEFDPFESFDGRGNRPVKVTDTERGVLMTFYSADEAAKAFYYLRVTIHRHIESGKLLDGCYRLEWLR